MKNLITPLIHKELEQEKNEYGKKITSTLLESIHKTSNMKIILEFYFLALNEFKEELKEDLNLYQLHQGYT